MMNVSEAAVVLGAELRGADVRFERVSTDTRTLKPGDLFVALRGEHFDGHGFLGAAHSAGAVAALIETTHTEPAPLPALVVADARLALGRLAAAWRRRFSLPLVALTGSSGKTTVKEMLAAILRAAVAGSGGVDQNASAVDHLITLALTAFLVGDRENTGTIHRDQFALRVANGVDIQVLRKTVRACVLLGLLR